MSTPTRTSTPPPRLLWVLCASVVTFLSFEFTRARGVAECRAMRKRRVVAAAVVALGLLVSTAFAVQEELLEQARKLVAEAKPFIEKANNVDIELEQRRVPRKEAF